MVDTVRDDEDVVVDTAANTVDDTLAVDMTDEKVTL